MKQKYSHISLARLCGWFGITRQAYYQNNWQGITTSIEEELVLEQVNIIRQTHRRMGTRKLYEKLEGFMLEHAIKMGRDGLFNLLASNGLLIRKRKRSVSTTNSHHWLRKYPNLIKDFIPTGINQVWVSDITYWKISTGEHLYISFITDAYSHKIVGYHVAQTLETVESIKALQMALSAFDGAESHLKLTHHSDRGIQYCSHAYVKLLQGNNIQISMTENGDPRENAIAERINGIIKGEYLETYQVYSVKQASELLDAVVELYNSDRPHMSIGNLTPNHVHQPKSNIITERLWKTNYRNNATFVNLNQDYDSNVKSQQDYSTNM